jgi:pimeloyl-ACP methyl ester carboxylesterase
VGATDYLTDPLPARHPGRVPRPRRGAGGGVPAYLGEAPESELIEGVGHFMLVEKPTEINDRILRFLGKA